MSPFGQGEVYVLDDGGEVDLDLGNYECFLDIKLTRDNNITTGKIYQSIIEKERRGDYLGKTVQVVPHITDAIQEWIERVAKIPVDGKEGPADVCVIELGGTIGPGNFCLVHVSLVPILNVVGEQKTKPTQHSVRQLRGLGLFPNLLACRCSKELDSSTKAKLAQFCHVPLSNVLTLHDVPNTWHIPLLLKVGDLGLSKVKCQTLISVGVRGTLPWMAPELLNGSSSLVSEKVDVFSFGIVMRKLLTGEEPYADLHYGAGAIIGGIVNNTLRPLVPESCDPDWRVVMERCWSSEPSERPSFTAIANDLRFMAAKISPKGQNQQQPASS